MLAVYKAAARPSAIYALTIAVIGAVFDQDVPTDKLLIIVSLLGAFAGLRSLDKKNLGTGNP